MLYLHVVTFYTLYLYFAYTYYVLFKIVDGRLAVFSSLNPTTHAIALTNISELFVSIYLFIRLVSIYLFIRLVVARTFF